MISKLKMRLDKETFESLTSANGFTPEEIIASAVEDAETELSVEVKNGSTDYQNDREYQSALVLMTIAVLFDRLKRSGSTKKDTGDREKAIKIMKQKYSGGSFEFVEVMPVENENG